ncbi:MAG: sulfatase, partial [Candidatus Thorarchaeota archaeon]
MNIIQIVSDTLRRDFLGCYGNNYIHTEHIDSLAKDSLVFDNYYTASFPTMPNRADMFTGKYTLTYLGWAPLPEEEVLLPEILKDAGFTTKAVVDLPVGYFFVGTGYNYDRGFADFENIRGQGKERNDINLQRRHESDYCAAATMTAASKWLERHYREKFFLYVDTWDPHEPWDPPVWYADMYYRGGFPSQTFDTMTEYDEIRDKVRKATAQITENDKRKDRKKRVRLGIKTTTGLGATNLSEIQANLDDELERLRALYAGEVTMVDRWVGMLLQKIEDLGLYENTVVIFTTDHGTYLGEHGYVHKRPHIYEEVGHIPLMIRLPDSEAVTGGRCDAFVQPPDIMPTLLELNDTTVPSTVQGKSLLPLIKGETNEIRELAISSQALVQGNRMTATSHEWSLIIHYSRQLSELYHLRTDSKQT